MTLEQWRNVLGSENFWSGVFASMLAAAIVAVLVFIFRNSFSMLKERRERGRRENEIFDSALRLSSPYAPFAFGAVQGKALRYFVSAVFFAYIGDIFSVLYPVNNLIYVIALYYVYLSLKWFFKIERRAVEIINSVTHTSKNDSGD